MYPVKVKICGITRLEDAVAAENAGAWAIGFIFYAKSPRYIEPDKAGYISSKLGPFITRVGVFVNENSEDVKKIIDIARLNAVQLHGGETPDYTCSFGSITVIKAFGTSEDFNTEILSKYKADAFLIDASDKEKYGGTGKLCNWQTAAECSRKNRVILAGGLDSENIIDAVRTVKPYAVDISSGVEISPGIKDRKKIENIFKILKTGYENGL